MRTDPIQPNFYQGTGGYISQLAEYLQGNLVNDNGSYRLSKPMPPKLRSQLVVCPKFLASDRSVRWSNSVCITSNTPQLIGARGMRSSLVVVESAQASGGFSHKDVQALAEGTTVGALSNIEINGVAHKADTLLVGLYRHGFIETDEVFPAFHPTYYMIEPTCILPDAPGIGRVAINQLNGRTIRLSEVSQDIFFPDKPLKKIPEPLHQNIITFVEAGMLRLVSGESTRAYN